MGYNIRLTDEAIQDIDNVFEYYEYQKKGLGFDFMVELYDYFEIITQSPKIFQVDFKDYRRAVLKRFSRYVIIYKIEKQDIYVMAIFNTLQNPDNKYK